MKTNFSPVKFMVINGQLVTVRVAPTRIAKGYQRLRKTHFARPKRIGLR